MKSNKGITLTSLIVYVIIFCTVIATVSTLTGYFLSNMNTVVITTETAQQYTKFTTYLSEDINSINLEKIEVKNNFIKIIFKDGVIHNYLYSNEKIYYILEEEGIINKKITICSNIKSCTFNYETDKLKINVLIDGIYYNNNYTIKNSQ